MSSVFDPKDLDLDLDDLDNTKKPVNDELAGGDFLSPNKKITKDWSTDYWEVSADAVFKEPEKKEEKPLRAESDLDPLSVIEDEALTTTPEEESSKPENRAEDISEDLYDINTESTEEEKEKKEILDQAVSSLDDLIDICHKNKYSYFTALPEEENVRIDFKIGDKVDDYKYISYRIYSRILIKAKTLGKFDIDVDNIEQSWEVKYEMDKRDFKLNIKTIPSDYGEKLYLKAKEIVKDKKTVKKSQVSQTQIFTFLLTMIIIVLLLLWAFMTFIVLNAKTPQDVEIFSQLWINIGEINRFIKSTVAIIFWFLMFVESIFFSIFAFKAILTKKSYKKQKTTATIIAAAVFMIIVVTGSLWMTLYKKELPNWASLARWSIQLYDNARFISPDFNLDQALLTNTENIIWPITVRYDLTNFVEEKASEWFYIREFLWDFWDWKDWIKTLNPIAVRTFDEEGLYKVSLEVSWVGQEGPETKPVDWIWVINISSSVIYNEEVLPNWGKIVSFDASSLSDEWSIRWYLDWSDDSVEMYKFQPWKTFFEDTYIWMKIVTAGKENPWFDKIFLVRWVNDTGIGWEIKYTQSKDDDLSFRFVVKDPKVEEWNWFITSYEWTFEWEDPIILSDIDVTSAKGMEDSSVIDYTFKNHGSQEVIVKMYDSAWNYRVIKEILDIPKSLELRNRMEIFVWWEKIEINDLAFKWRYSLWWIEVPTDLKFDARKVKAENLLYALENVSWDFDNDWRFDKTGKLITHEIIDSGIVDIVAEYKFVHRKDKKDIIKVKEFIDLEALEREVMLNFSIDYDSDYAPVIVKFDASRSQIKGQDIIKFVYDYWDWTPPEERDAINKGHRYVEPWTYRVKLTAVTNKWEEHSVTKLLVLKKQPDLVRITSSMNSAPILQEIDFSSAKSVWDIDRYLWDFWDWQKSRDANPSHFYTEPWVYTVKLQVDFTNNNRLETTHKIVITE